MKRRLRPPFFLLFPISCAIFLLTSFTERSVLNALGYGSCVPDERKPLIPQWGYYALFQETHYFSVKRGQVRLYRVPLASRDFYALFTLD